MRADFSETIEINGRRLQLSLTPARTDPALAAEWQTLASVAGSAVFLSWPWISAFQAGLPTGFEPYALKVRAGEALVAVALLVGRDEGGRTSRWAFNESGDPKIDSPTLEYNRLLVDPAAPAGLTPAVLAKLMTPAFATGSMLFGGLSADMAADVRAAADAAGWLARPLQTQEAFWLDLRPFEGRPDRFVTSLGRNTRAALQRAQRLFEADGALHWETAQTPGSAFEILAELEHLHTAQWRARGQRGAFAQATFRPFHERLIAAGFDRGMIRLHRLRCNGRTLGCLYNLTSNGTVYAYQSGFAFDADNRRKPGYVMHGFAIRQAIEEGVARYDFCAGATRLKESFSSHREPMVWLEMNPATPLNRLIAWARGAKKSLRSVGVL